MLLLYRSKIQACTLMSYCKTLQHRILSSSLSFVHFLRFRTYKTMSCAEGPFPLFLFNLGAFYFLFLSSCPTQTSTEVARLDIRALFLPSGGSHLVFQTKDNVGCPSKVASIWLSKLSFLLSLMRVFYHQRLLDCIHILPRLAHGFSVLTLSTWWFTLPNFKR